MFVLVYSGCAQQQQPETRISVPVEDITWLELEGDSWLSHHTGSLVHCDSVTGYLLEEYVYSHPDPVPCLLAESLEKLDRVPMDRIERILCNYSAREKPDLAKPDPRLFMAFNNQDSLWVNLFAAVEIDNIGPNGNWKASISTEYPLTGKISIQLEGPSTATWTLAFRQPGWTDNRPDPLGKYLWKTNRKLTLELAGEYLYPEIRKGYAYLTREWTSGDVVEIEFPMSVRRFVTTTGDEDQLQLEYGPVGLATAKDPKENMSLPDRDFLQKNIGVDGIDEWVWTYGGEEWFFRRFPEFSRKDELWISSPYPANGSSE